MLQDIKLGTKISASFLLIALIAAAVGSFNALMARKIGGSLSTMHDKTVIPLVEMQSISVSSQMLRVDLRDLILVESDQELDAIAARIDALTKAVDDSSRAYEATFLDAEDRRLFGEFRTAWQDYAPVRDRIVELARAGKDAEATAFMHAPQQRKTAMALQAAIDRVVDFNNRAAAGFEEAGLRLAHRSMWGSIVLLLLNIAISLAIGAWLARLIARPLDRSVVMLEAVARGDLRQRLETSGTDEIGRLSFALDQTVDGLSRSIHGIRGQVVELSGASEELSAVSAQLAQGATRSGTRLESVSASAEQMSANMQSVSAAAEQSASNISTVAAAVEELTASIAEIAHSAEETRQVTAEAVSNAEAVARRVGELSEASREISKVIEVVVEIAEQTKLLALNATIEAARAGEAGKGFAVVAGEVKELAKGTGEATEEIRRRIGQMQASTEGTVGEISSIRRVIGRVDQIVGGIASAVEEQSITTKDISGNVSQAAGGIREVTRNVAEAAQGATSVAREIAGLRADSRETEMASGQVRASAAQLAQAAQEVQALVARFELRA